MDTQTPQNQIQMASLPTTSLPKTQFNPAQFSMLFQQPPQQQIPNQHPVEQVSNTVSLPGPLGPFNKILDIPTAQASEVAPEPKQKQPGLFGKFFSGLFNKTINIQNQPANISNFAVQPVKASTVPTYDTKIFDIKPRETNKLVSLLVAEAGDEGNTGMQAVLNSIVNRTQVNPSLYGKNVWDVLTKPVQYSAFSNDNKAYTEVRDYLDGKNNKLTPGREEQISQAKQLIDLAKTGQLQDITNGATHFYNPNTAVHYPWMDTGEFKKDIGNHRFIYLYK